MVSHCLHILTSPLTMFRLRFTLLVGLCALGSGIVHTHAQPPVSPPSVETSVHQVITSLLQLGHSLSSEYYAQQGNGSHPLANWLAYRAILEQVNVALSENLTNAFLEKSLPLSADCYNDLLQFLSGLSSQQSWVYRILDANGLTLPSGILEGNFVNFGDFDECVETMFTPSFGESIHGHYCLIKVSIEVPSNQSRLRAQDFVFNTSGTALDPTVFRDFLRYAHYFKVRQGRIGLCVPSGCSHSDVDILIKNVVQVDKLNVEVDSCQLKSDLFELSLLQVVIHCVLIALGTIIGTATIMDLSSRSYKTPTDGLSAIMSKLSAYSNLKTLMKCKTGSDNLRSINGIRVLTMCWLVYGHAYLLSVKETFRSSTHFIESLFDVKMFFILNSWPAVDVFFLISALLHSYHLFKVINVHHKINIAKMVLNRVFRLWPSLWLIVALAFIVPNFGQGPMWPEMMKVQVDSCYCSWWKTITFMANIRTGDDMCHVHIWYLSADMQLFLLSFIFILFIYRYQKMGITILSIVVLIISALITLYFYINQYLPTVLFNHIDEMQIYEDMSKIYMPTYLHLTPYLVGILTGYLLVQLKKNHIKLNWWVNLVLCLVSYIVLGAILASGYLFTADLVTSLLVTSFYAGFHRLIWSLAVAYLIVSFELKQGGVLGQILRSKFFIPLSKLCYLIYLIHFVVTWARYAYIRQPLMFSSYTLFNEFLVNLIYSLTLAVFFYLLVEAPFTNLYSYYIGRRSWSIGEWKLRHSSQSQHAQVHDDLQVKTLT